MNEKINAVLILEILGKPADYVKKVLADVVKKLGEEKDVKILNKNIAKPKQLEDKDIFTSFAEIEIQTSLQKLMLLIFFYMPSHIEIIEPENLQIRNSDMNLFLNDLLKKLHQYDEIAKALMLERRAIAQKIKEGKIKIEPKKPEKKSRKKKKR